MVEFAGPEAVSAVFRSALCFWEDGGVKVEAGPWAIAEYLEYPEGSRFLQSFKSVAASSAFEHASVFDKRMRFEDLGDGRTKILNTSLFFTREERDGMLGSGMEKGMNQSYAALDRLLERLR